MGVGAYKKEKESRKVSKSLVVFLLNNNVTMQLKSEVIFVTFS